MANYEAQLFEQELEKFRPHQNRLLQANHKQSGLMKELTGTFNRLLQDKRVHAEQSKYEVIQRNRSSVINRYKRIYEEFLDLEAGLHSAKNWYAEMRETVDSLEKNVEVFVNNRRAEGATLLNQIEQERASTKNSHAEMERERLRELMDRMSMEPSKSSPQPQAPGRAEPPPQFQPGQAPRYGSFQGQYPGPASPPAQQPVQHSTYQGFQAQRTSQGYNSAPANTYGAPTYNPSTYGPTPGPTSPPATQSTFGHNAMRGPASPPPNQATFGQRQSFASYSSGQTQHQSYVPPGFVPPPPPPGPPPLGPQQTIHYGNKEYDATQSQAQNQQQQQAYDPWAGLTSWK